jgi:hypothetical protein
MFFSLRTGNYFFFFFLTTKGKPFTPGTINYIFGMAGTMTATNIGRVLHRSEKSIRRFAEKNDINLKVE